jgi:prevent-host-death family protein
MGKAISAAEANRKFSALLRNVRAGHSYVVTSHGRPVARILPFPEETQVSRTARATLLERLKAAPVRVIGPWNRDELYDDPQ